MAVEIVRPGPAVGAAQADRRGLRPDRRPAAAGSGDQRIKRDTDAMREIVAPRARPARHRRRRRCPRRRDRDVVRSTPRRTGAHVRRRAAAGVRRVPARALPGCRRPRVRAVRRGRHGDVLHVVGSPAVVGLPPARIRSPAKETVEIDVAIRRLDDVVGDAAGAARQDRRRGRRAGGVRRRRARSIERDRPVLLFEHARVHATSFGTTPGDVWTLLDELDYTVAPIADGAQVLDRGGLRRAVRGRPQPRLRPRTRSTNWIARPR